MKTYPLSHSIQDPKNIKKIDLLDYIPGCRRFRSNVPRIPLLLEPQTRPSRHELLLQGYSAYSSSYWEGVKRRQREYRLRAFIRAWPTLEYIY